MDIESLCGGPGLDYIERMTGEKSSSWSGKEAKSPSPPPLRTVRAPCNAYGSSLHERPSREAAWPVSNFLFEWICPWQLECNNPKLSNVSPPPRLRQTRWWMCQASS